MEKLPSACEGLNQILLSKSNPKKNNLLYLEYIPIHLLEMIPLSLSTVVRDQFGICV